MSEMAGPASPLPEGRADGREALARQVRAAVIAGPMANMVRYGHLEAAADAVVAAILAAPVVAVPEAGERACDCPTNEAGDIRCHVCREYVNKRCWNCHTPRGEGPCPNPAPAALTDAEKAEMVAALDDLNGPVGVQPEPAEPSEWADLQLERQMKAAWKEADRHRAQPAGPGIPAHCGVCFTAWPCEVAQDRPAVPVVHPEPGDRAEEPRESIWAQAFGDDAPEAWAALSPQQRGSVIEALLPIADVEVAAAVDAVRADRDRLAGQVAAIRALPEKWALRASTQYGRPDYRRIYNDCAADLLAVVASSPTTPEAKK